MKLYDELHGFFFRKAENLGKKWLRRGTIGCSTCDVFRSMKPAVKEVRELNSSLADSEPDIPEWVLTGFRDPDAELVKKADNIADLKSGLLELEFGGDITDDIPEQAFKGTM